MTKIKSNPISLLTFLFLFSGNIIFNLYYSSGNPVICHLVTSALIFVFTATVAAIDKTDKKETFPKFLRFILPAASLVCLFLTVYTYAASLGTFADYYATLPVLVFASVLVVLSGFFGAKKGKKALIGFAYMTATAMIVWTFAGFLGFFHTKKLVPVEFSSLNVTSDNIVEMLRSALFMSVDIILVFFAVKEDKEKNTEKSTAAKMLCGVGAYILLCGINIVKNVFMFGGDFLSGLENPDLAAIRLIPMFELPEISVIVNTFAVTLKVMLYIHVILCCLRRKNSSATDCDSFFTVSSI